MKSAYELAMERLNKTAPTVKLTPEQKAKIAELESVYAAKIAEKEIYLKEELSKARETGDPTNYMEAEQRLSHERKALQAQLEEKKEAVRAGKA
ncbi:MAG TPA: hypothetical protein VEH27_11565 [Methylomirabilota bacterium]|nr:hypothetical protein [Methylomirabilota bacterium]